MVANTRNGLVQPLKRTPSQKKRENLLKTLKPAVKRVPKGQFIHADNADKEVHETTSDTNESIPQPIEDVSSVKFTLSWSLLLDAIEITTSQVSKGSYSVYP